MVPEICITAENSLAVQHYPCKGNALQEVPLVMLHGWGCDNRIWQPLLPLLNQHLHIITLDLPGFGDSLPACPESEEQLLALMEAALPGCCLLLGWSLGGMLATAFAARYPQRVNGLVTVAANACFSQRDNWQTAMPAATFDDFYRFFARQPHDCLKRFHGLQARGDVSAMSVLKHLRAAFAVAEEQVPDWQRALQLLNIMDNRSALRALRVPGLHVFGENDSLVPAAAAAAVGELNSRQRSIVLEGAGHAMPVSCPETLAETVLAFLQRSRYSFGKERVAESFGRAAASYDQAARLQKRVGQLLMEKLPAGLQPGCIVDIGCGTGFLTRQLKQKYPSASVIGLDLAEGMLQFSRSDSAAADHWVCGDAECLPLADNSVDLVFSSLTFQWCTELPTLASELERVLAPGGIVAFSSLCDGTLHELRRAWSAVDGYIHVNRFVDRREWQAALSATGLACRQLETVPEVLYYDEVLHLLRELKDIGAHNINSGQNRTLTGRRQLLTMIQAYESAQRKDGRLPATWQVLYGLATLENSEHQ